VQLTDRLSVIVIDDHIALRAGMELVLRREGMAVVGVAGDADAARVLLSTCPHDVALIDVRLGSSSSLDLVSELLRSNPHAAIVLHTGYTDPDSGLADAARMGARGFVLKSSPVSRMLDALRFVAAGGHYVDPDLAALLAVDTEPSRLATLTAREHEALGLLGDGLDGSEIASRLALPPATARMHVRSATSKLGAPTRVQAVATLVAESRLRGELRSTG